jgi:uncharacterized repeat protein (TIGR04138 family)
MELCREPPHFAYEAYEFVSQAVSFTQDRLGRKDDDDESDDRHVTGGELLRGVCDLAVMQFGMMAPVVFKLWHVRSTADIGRMVFDLIEIGSLSKSDRDSPEDFQALFDLQQALAEGFEFTLEDHAGVKRGSA